MTTKKQNVERRFFAELRAEEAAGEPRLAGYAAVFDEPSVDLGGFVERIAPGAFARSLREREQIHAFWDHDSGMPLGSTKGGKLMLSEDGRGLAFELSGKRLSEAQLDAVRDGDMQMSFGFYTRADEWDRSTTPPTRTLKDVDLFEVSMVAMPAYPQTDVALRSLAAATAEEVEAPAATVEEPPVTAQPASEPEPVAEEPAPEPPAPEDEAPVEPDPAEEIELLRLKLEEVA